MRHYICTTNKFDLSALQKIAGWIFPLRKLKFREEIDPKTGYRYLMMQSEVNTELGEFAHSSTQVNLPKSKLSQFPTVTNSHWVSDSDRCLDVLYQWGVNGKVELQVRIKLNRKDTSDVRMVACSSLLELQEALTKLLVRGLL